MQPAWKRTCQTRTESWSGVSKEKKIVLFDNNILLLLQSCRGIPADNLVHMLRPHRGGEIKRKRSVPPRGMALGEEQP